MRYHPEPFQTPSPKKGYRKVHERLNFISNQFDFTEKSVLDLGCSNGFYSFELSRLAKEVIAIDSDSDAIKDNSERASKWDISNIEFRNAAISPELIESLPKVNATLFLSVLHHIITASGIYVSSDPKKAGKEHAIEILRAIRKRTDVLFFDIGQSNESHHWAKKMPDMGSNPGKWVIEELLTPAGFSNVELFDPLEKSGALGEFLKKLYFSKYNRYLSGPELFPRAFRRLCNYSEADSRIFFIARND